MRQNKHIIKVAVRTPTCPLVHPNSYSMRTGGVYGAPYAKKTVSQSVFINEDIYRINKLTTTDKALYRFYVANKSIPPIHLRELF